MRKIVTALLLLAAVLVGLLLPAASTRIQNDRAERQDEAAGVQQVNLTASSGLSIVEKMAMLADPESSLLNVGLGRYQTAESLSRLSWQLLDNILNYYMAPLLQSVTVTQTEQMAVLVSRGDQAYIFWEVILEDGLGRILRLCLDDETGQPVAMAYVGDEDEDMGMWAELALSAMVDVSEYEYNLAAEEEQEETNALEESTLSEKSVTISDAAGEERCEVPIQCGQNWFYLNGTHLG